LDTRRGQVGNLPHLVSSLSVRRGRIQKTTVARVDACAASKLLGPLSVCGNVVGMVIQKGMWEETQFLNVDLDIYSKSDVQPLVDAFGKAVLVLFAGRIQRTYKAVLEVNKLTKDADATIRVFCLLIRALPRPAKQLWNAAKTRDFSIGIQSADKPPSMDFALSADTVKQAAEVGARIVITVYAPDRSVIARDPGIMSGAPVFRGTRVLVSTLLDYVETGRGLDQFLNGFPTVTRGQVFQLFQEARAAGVRDAFDPEDPTRQISPASLRRVRKALRVGKP
jgi:uncharacterized protein (DUF433 family)